MPNFFKYPRTYHLPDSPGLSGDDKRIESLDRFFGQEIVVTEKMDGENTSLYRDHYHARSLDSKNHPSRNAVKGIWGNIKHEIPENWRIVGENLFACHSIHYHFLPAYFLVFAVYDEKNTCLSWDETVSYAEMLGLKTVPVLYRGVWDEEKVRACWTGKCLYQDGMPHSACPTCNSTNGWDEQEGYVTRLTDNFDYQVHHLSVVKWVRKGHVQTDSHWMEREPIPNLLHNHNNSR